MKDLNDLLKFVSDHPFALIGMCVGILMEQYLKEVKKIEEVK